MRMRLRRKNEQGVYLLQLTSMVDMFTIILVFLLKSYSTSAYQVTPSEQLELPFSQTQEDPEEGLKVALSNTSLTVEDQLIFEWKGESGWREYLHPDQKRFFPELHQKLKKQAENTKALQEMNEKLEVGKHIILQVDKEASYALIQAVMATAALSGYKDLHLLTLKE